MSADYVFLNRLGLTRGDHDIITAHRSRLSWHGPGPMTTAIRDKSVSYPFTFPRESMFMSLLSGAYEIVARFEDSSGIFPVKDAPVFGVALLARRRA